MRWDVMGKMIKRLKVLEKRWPAGKDGNQLKDECCGQHVRRVCHMPLRCKRLPVHPAFNAQWTESISAVSGSKLTQTARMLPQISDLKPGAVSALVR